MPKTNNYEVEYRKITEQYGAYEATVILGGIESYKRMRTVHTYDEILTEIDHLHREW